MIYPFLLTPTNSMAYGKAPFEFKVSINIYFQTTFCRNLSKYHFFFLNFCIKHKILYKLEVLNSRP